MLSSLVKMDLSNLKHDTELRNTERESSLAAAADRRK